MLGTASSRLFWIMSLVFVMCGINCYGTELVPGKAGFSGKDITSTVFGSGNEEVFPVTYADFNSDKITDIFALSRDQSTLWIFFGQENVSPLFKPHVECKLQENWEALGFPGKNAPLKIVGVVAADFNGDGLLDVMITYRRYPINDLTESETATSSCNQMSVEAIIFRGNLTSLDCNVRVDKEDAILNLVDEPLALDINGDMVMDLFGEVWVDVDAESKGGCKETTKKIWIFKPVSSQERPIPPPEPLDFTVLKNNFEHDHDKPCMRPHANAFADVNGDLVPELVLITAQRDHSHNVSKKYQRETYRINLEKREYPKFELLNEISILLPSEHSPELLGQSIIMDLNQDGTLLHLMPFCSSSHCRTTNGILVVTEQGASILPIEFADKTGIWTYPAKKGGIPNNNIYSNYSESIVLRAGDFNLDGFPDLIGILRPHGPGDTNSRAVIFENVPCVSAPSESPATMCPYPRTFKINFDGLAHYRNVTLATFFDIHEDGLVDILLVRRTNEETQPYKDTYGVFAFQNSPDYDANFMKVMVLSGVYCDLCPESQTPYGNIISGPVIKYMSTMQSGLYQTAVASQLYRSSHMAMDLPYTIFGIGQSPNFIETLEISVSSDPRNLRVQQWSQIIPNSQIIVIPSPLDQPSSWSAKLFLTPSQAVLNTGLVLVGFFTIICLIVGGLQYRERRDDMKTRLEEAHRFHMM